MSNSLPRERHTKEYTYKTKDKDNPMDWNKKDDPVDLWLHLNVPHNYMISFISRSCRGVK